MSEKKERVRLVTPIGRLSFPAIFEKEKPMPNDPPGKEQKYAATIIFDNDYLKKNPEEMKRFQAIKAEVEKCCVEKFKKSSKEAREKITQFWYPIRDGASKDHLDGFGEGKTFFKASTKRRVGAVGPDKVTPITDKEALYAGCYVRLSVTPYSYDNAQKGLAIGLNSLIFIRDGERLDGGSDPTDDFGSVDVDALDLPDEDDNDLLA